MSDTKRLFAVLASLAGVVGLGIVLVAIQSTPSYAIPAFARKYQTSCTTCHNNFPELNDFGEAFKKNGFKFPKDDESFVKEPPVLLGAKAQKEEFPNAVYPGEIPGTLPLGFRYSGFFNWNKKQPPALQAAGFVPQTDLFAPNTFTVIAAGSMGSNLSFWIDDDISTGGSGADGGLGDGYPWMIATVRYDFVNSPADFANGASEHRTRNRFSPGFQMLVRANIKITGEYQYQWRQPYTDPTTGNTLFFRPNSFVTGIDYVF